MYKLIYIYISIYYYFNFYQRVCIGSEMSGGVENVTVEESHFYNNPASALRIKS